MLKVQNLALPWNSTEEDLLYALQREVGAKIQRMHILRKSIDARKKPNVKYIYTVAAETEREDYILSKCRKQNVSRLIDKSYQFPYKSYPHNDQPVIIGAGPAGLFCALMLCEIGAKPIVIEQGEPAEIRCETVRMFRENGILNPDSNIQFGEGGAGTFSDGKLSTGLHNVRIEYILDQFARFGAPDTVRYDAMPHVGTDYLVRVVMNIRREIQRLGGTFLFSTKVTDFEIDHGALSALIIRNQDTEARISANHVALAIGNSARQTFTKLYQHGVFMERKPFSVGVRIEHLQNDITRSQYGFCDQIIPPASYKLAWHGPDGHSAYSFCVCPGGEVVAAASESGRVCTNGMSEYARSGRNINGGLLVNVAPEDVPGEGPLAGIHFQRQLEEAAFLHGGGNYYAPCQRLDDFLNNRPSTGAGKISPTYTPGVKWTDLNQILPAFVVDTMKNALPAFNSKVQGFLDPDAILTGVETRSSCPLRIIRDNNGQSNIAGLFPCGEGAGYAGGIMSAASDGIQTAEKMCAQV